MAEKEHRLQWRIREASSNDLLAIRTIHAKSWLATYPNEENGVTKEWVKERVSRWTTLEGIRGSVERFKDIFGNPEHFYRIAKKGHSIVGLIHGSKLNGVQELKALYIDQSEYGSGLAQELIGRAIDWFDAGKSIELEVATYNARAICFYEKQGFEIVPGTEKVFAEKIPIIEMVKRGEKYEI